MDIITKKLFSTKVIEPLVKCFEKVSDRRFKRGVRYKLTPILILLFLSKLGGADEPSEVSDWVEFRFSDLKELLDLDWERSPHEVTWERIMNNALDGEEVEQVFGAYLLDLSDEDAELLNLDGKVLCSTREAESEQQLHLLALQEAEQNVVLEQVALTAGENEISGAKRLLKQTDVKDKIVSGDAIFAQKELSKTIVRQGGDYLWKLRSNQKRMYQEAVKYFAEIDSTDENRRDVESAKSLDKGHGRIEAREILISYRVANRVEFPYLEQVFRIKREVLEIKSRKQSVQEIYGITSVDGMRADAEQILAWTRKHWSIENGLHRRRDTTFKEDQVRRQNHNGGRVMASLNNLAIGLLRRLGWKNLARARRYFAVKIEQALSLILHPIKL